MHIKKYTFNLPLIILTILFVGGLFGIGLYRIQIDSDVIGLLPQNDPVISDARHILMNHPIQDQLAIDVTHQKDNPDILVDGGKLIERMLRESGLFKKIGMEDEQNLIPELIIYIGKNLPLMFSEKDLNDSVKPLLEPLRVHRKLKANFLRLITIEGIGQAELISMDPLGMRNIVMSKLSHLIPSRNSKIYKKQLISSDGRHLLIIAKPICSSTDTTFGRTITQLMHKISNELNRKYLDRGYKFTITPVGAYRAALDNELIAKTDTKRAILFSTIGIALLLLFAFPRPLLGLLSLLPAIVGTLTAFFVYSLFHRSISIMAIGFGGAIISISVDHGIAYLLFLDRPHESFGKDASREVMSIALLSTLTTVGAFLALSMSGFPLLSQIGQFAALGIAFSFIFVHVVFPLIFPVMPPSRGKRTLPLKRFVNKLAMGGGKYKVYFALAFAFIMLFFAKPVFHVDLRSMNTVSKETIAAENLMANVWGDIFSKIFLLMEGDSPEELLQKGDQVLTLLEQENVSGMLSSAFIPSMIFPGEERKKQNFAAWKKFWNNKKKTELKKLLKESALDIGFAPDAFKPFYRLIDKKEFNSIDIPERLLSLGGISKSHDKSTWIQFATLTPASSYRAEIFYSKLTSSGIVKVFDPQFFSKKLGDLLAAIFLKMLLIIGISVVILLFLFFVEWRLTLIAVMPIIFALICSLGILKLIDQPLGIPGLMLSIVVIGMGIDYSIFFVRSYQRYFDENHPYLGLIRMSVFLASASTIIGFGTLSLSHHSLLRSAGLISVIGIAFSLIGVFTILPYVLKHLFAPARFPVNNLQHETKIFARVFKRYKYLEAYPRLFAWFKLKLDPMFNELADFLESPRKIIDIGSGYGVPAAWLLELFPKAHIFGIEPNYERARIASKVLGERGKINLGSAPDIPKMPGLANAALMLDMIHYLNDDELKLTLKRVNHLLIREGRLIIRVMIPSKKRISWFRCFENFKLKLHKITPYYRSIEEIQTILFQTGFKTAITKCSGSEREETWFITFARKETSRENEDIFL